MSRVAAPPPAPEGCRCPRRLTPPAAWCSQFYWHSKRMSAKTSPRGIVRRSMARSGGPAPPLASRKEATMAIVMDPFDALASFQQALDAYRTSGWLDSSVSGGGGYPPVNVFRKGDDFIIIAELPGVKKSDLDVQVKGRTIRLSGAKTVSYPEKVGAASARTARRPVRPRSDHAGRDQPGQGQGRIPRRRAGVVPAARREREAEVDQGGVTWRHNSNRIRGRRWPRSRN